MGHILFLLILLHVAISTSGQTETDRYIHWQADRRLKGSDYMGSLKEDKYDQHCDTYGLCTIASTGLWAILDLPKRKRDRGPLKEKAWFSAVFDKHESFAQPGDTVGLLVQQMIFDVEELWARWARKELNRYEVASNNAYGMTHIMFDDVKKQANEKLRRMVNQITTEVYVEPEEGAIMKWRELVDELLAEVSEFATSPEDAARFINGAPIDERYEVAPYVITSKEGR